jgi:hypothetical protein
MTPRTRRWSRSRALALLAVAAVASGCFTVHAEAPYLPHDVRLLPQGEPVEVTRRYQKWYAIWGIFPMAGPDPAEVIHDEGLVEARVYTEDAIEDVVSGFFYTLMFPAGIILPQTIVVEGNRRPSEERAGIERTCPAE